MVGTADAIRDYSELFLTLTVYWLRSLGLSLSSANLFCIPGLLMVGTADAIRDYSKLFMVESPSL